MSIAGFLIDEPVPASIRGALLVLEPTIYVETVGLPGFPIKGTPDPELIDYAQVRGLILVTNDKSTMPAHSTDHLLAGKHHAGVIAIRNDRSTSGKIAEDLLLVWCATDSAYWIDKLDWIPFSNS